jgi:hypothetical protein
VNHVKLIIVLAFTALMLLVPYVLLDRALRHQHADEFRWDQESLKTYDSGCPTAIFEAPGGVLRQCP